MPRMTKRINMKPVEAAAPVRKSMWPLIIFGTAAGMTWSWLDPEGADSAARASLNLVAILTQQGFDTISDNMRQMLASRSI